MEALKSCSKKLIRIAKAASVLARECAIHIARGGLTWIEKAASVLARECAIHIARGGLTRIGKATSHAHASECSIHSLRGLAPASYDNKIPA